MDQEKLQPTEQELADALAKARTYWHNLAKRASLKQQDGIVLRQTELYDMLCQIPAMPTKPGKPSIFEISLNSKALELETSSTWRVSSQTNCGVEREKKTINSSLLIGCQRSPKCHFMGSSQAEDSKHITTNYLNPLILGWTYILSALLIELQGQDHATIRYTKSLATTHDPDDADEHLEGATIDLGSLEPSAARWWAAILAPVQGWQATIFSQGDQEYQTPWCLSLDRKFRFRIICQLRKPLGQIESHQPPSAEEAFRFLADLVIQHNLGTRVWIALSVASLFPTHYYYRVPVKLPVYAGHHDRGHDTVVSGDLEWINVRKMLLYYLTLSCNPKVIMSSLCGVFWDNSITCNLVSPWLHPILYEIPNSEGLVGNSELYYNLLALVCAIRRPPLAPLWCGAAISGLVATVLRFTESGTPELDPIAYPWLGCPQSFMDTCPPGSYFTADKKISRADAWQIRYLPCIIEDDLHYENWPFSPWKPVGETIQAHCDLRVMQHTDCQRHQLAYQYWTWNFSDGSTINDKGYRNATTTETQLGLNPKANQSTDTTFSSLPLPSEQSASQSASQTILQWVTVNGEGIPNEGIYYDEWVKDFLSGTDSESPSVISDIHTSEPEDPLHSSNMFSDKKEQSIVDWLSIS